MPRQFRVIRQATPVYGNDPWPYRVIYGPHEYTIDGKSVTLDEWTYELDQERLNLLSEDAKCLPDSLPKLKDH